MTLWVDAELFLPTRVRYVEPNGDATEYRLARLRPNVEMPEERFDLELPEGVEREEGRPRRRARRRGHALIPGRRRSRP